MSVVSMGGMVHVNHQSVIYVNNINTMPAVQLYFCNYILQ